MFEKFKFMISALKVDAVCRNMGMDPETRDLYNIVNSVSMNSPKGVDSFVLGEGETSDEKIRFLEQRLGPEINRFADGIRRVLDDSNYREQIIYNYVNNVKPRAERYSFWDAIRMS